MHFLQNVRNDAVGVTAGKVGVEDIGKPAFHGEGNDDGVVALRCAAERWGAVAVEAGAWGAEIDLLRVVEAKPPGRKKAVFEVDGLIEYAGLESAFLSTHASSKSLWSTKPIIWMSV